MVDDAAPFPFDHASMSHAEVGRLNQYVKRFPNLEDGIARLRGPLEQLLGAPLTLKPSAPRVVAAQRSRDALFDPGVAIAIDGEDAARVVLMLDARIAAVLVNRAVGGEGGPAIGGPVALSATESGVIAFLVAFALRQLELGWVVARVEVREPATLLPATDALRSDVSVFIAGDRGLARLLIGTQSLRPQPPTQMSSLPVTLIARRGTATLSRHEAGTLEHGDIVILSESTNEIWVHARGDSSRLFECTADHGSLTITRCVERPPVEVGQGAKTVNDPANEEAPTTLGTAALDDVPIEVSAEVARFTLPLAELTHLKPGEVLTSGVALSDRVTLRVGDKVIAVGELVEVDGEIGVRVNTLAP